MTKKISTLLLSIIFYAYSYAQVAVNLQINFDSTNVNYNLGDFGGNASAIVTDPVVSSNKVAQITKSNTAETWAGTTLGTSGLATAIPFTASLTKITMRVYSPDANIPVRMKVEDATNGAISVETEARTTLSNAWETLEFNFANQAGGTAALDLSKTYKKLSVFFNFNVAGSAAGTKVYYCDDVKFVTTSGPVLAKIKLPINFDSTNVDYTMVDFGGNASSVVADPNNAANKVGKVIKGATAELWAGTTLSTSSGLANAIPFVAGSTKLSVRVYSPDTGIMVRLKAEDPTDPTKSVETEAKTKVKNGWDVLVFDFANQASGTAAINFGYTYKMLSIFFNFGVTGVQAGGAKTYYFDNVVFGAGGPPPPPAKVNVKFKVDMKNTSVKTTDTLTLNGTFNGWCGVCTPMTLIAGTKIYEATVALDTATEYEFKYVIGNWTVQETLAVALPCVKTTGAFTNRLYKSGSKNDSLPLVCWNTCSTCFNSGINKEEVNAIQIYPNPAKEVLHINIGQATSNDVFVHIYNVLGELVMDRTLVQSNNNEMDFDIRALKPGIYIVKCQIGSLEKTMKLQID